MYKRRPKDSKLFLLFESKICHNNRQVVVQHIPQQQFGHMLQNILVQANHLQQAVSGRNNNYVTENILLCIRLFNSKMIFKFC